jgi:hypothetical protein
VQESKDNTDRLLGEVRTEGGLPTEKPDLSDGGLLIYGGDKADDAGAMLGRFMASVRPGDYVALLAYLTENGGHEEALQGIREMIHDRMHAAVTVGYGPRYLHSTGQLHKGGADKGVFILLTAEDPGDIPLPGRSYGFATFRHAQARGDLEALRSHGRRVVRVHMADGAEKGLKELEKTLSEVKMAVPV